MDTHTFRPSRRGGTVCDFDRGMPSDDGGQNICGYPAGHPIHVAAAEPADGSLLDLVRRHGDERFMDGHRPTRSAELFDRIAALVPQQPVQARDGDAGLWWQHLCDWVRAYPVNREPEPTWCPSCTTPGPWRPLLVGGDSVPTVPDDAALLLAAAGRAQEINNDALQALAELRREIQRAIGQGITGPEALNLFARIERAL